MPPSFGKQLRYIRSRFYSGILRRVIRKAGINKLLARPYWQLVYALSENTQTQHIGDCSINFHTSTFTEFMRFRNLAGERSVVEELLDNLNSEDVFYDIGANVGSYTCFAAANLGFSRTIAFEPEPTNANRLRENLDLNDLHAKIVRVALSDTDGTAKLALNGDEAGEGKHAIATNDNEQTLEVETARGDTVIKERGLPKPTVMKIDVEGAELSVLRGLQETLHESCRLVYVEVHPEKIADFGGDASKVETFLTDTGFEVTTISQRGSEIFLRASK